MRRLLNVVVSIHVAVYRLTGGRVAGRVRPGAPVLLLTTTGRNTGRQRTTPLLFLRHDDAWVVVASAGGAASHPAWYLNLRHTPAAAIQVGTDKVSVTAATAGRDERAALWPLVTQMWPQYDDYQAKTAREIPVVVLTRSSLS